MTNKSIIVAAAILIAAILAYLLVQDRQDSGSTVTPNPSPSQTPAPTPAPNPAPEPSPTSQDYKQPFKNYSGKSISIDYPSTWTLTMPSADDEYGIATILSPNTKKNLDSGNTYPGYYFDISLQRFTQLDPNEYQKRDSVTVGGKAGYRVDIAGAGSNPGVVVEHNSFFYVIGFQPGMEKALQDKILKYVRFTK